MASANSKTPGDCFENAHSPASIKQPDAHNFCCQPSSLIFFFNFVRPPELQDGRLECVRSNRSGDPRGLTTPPASNTKTFCVWYSSTFQSTKYNSVVQRFVSSIDLTHTCHSAGRWCVVRQLGTTTTLCKRSNRATALNSFTHSPGTHSQTPRHTHTHSHTLTEAYFFLNWTECTQENHKLVMQWHFSSFAMSS